MARIPGTIFLIGSPQGQGNPEERPQTERIVGDFWLDKTEVTVAAYRACVERGACSLPKPDDPFCTWEMRDHDEHPINCVSWPEAQAYCAFAGKRLPTEAEWELAGSGGAENRRFSWGDNDPTTSIACFSHPGGTCKVASFPAGAYGLFDMSGNVWEWTASPFAVFPAEPSEGPRRVFKGGSWSRRWPKWLRVKNRSHWEPEKRNSWLGFRCAKSPLPVHCPEESKAEGDRCVRASGVPRCEPRYGWNGSACAELDTRGLPTGKVAGQGSEGMAGSPDDEIVLTRTPKDDADCIKNYREKVAAYRWTGNTWDARVKRVKERGCTRRDNAPTWVSACCPN